MIAVSDRSCITMVSLDSTLTMLHLLLVAKRICRWISSRSALRPRMTGPPGTHNCHSASSDIMERIFSTSGFLSELPSPHASQNSLTKFSCARPTVILLWQAFAASRTHDHDLPA